jgi:hypothetical protein
MVKQAVDELAPEYSASIASPRSPIEGSRRTEKQVPNGIWDIMSVGCSRICCTGGHAINAEGGQAMLDKIVEDVIRAKAESMSASGEYKKDAKEFAKQINDPEKVFLAGAIDGMSFDVAALTNPRRLPSFEERKKLIKDILGI